jgi:hypothetical protein
MTVLETLRCPGCSTRFLLRTERVRNGIKRAKCFRCSAIFGIAEEVTRLLAPVPATPPPGSESAPPLTMEDLFEFPGEIHEDIPVPAEAAAQAEPAPAPAAPEPAPAPAAPGNGFASAKEAIAKLMGSAPAAPTGAKVAESRSMDLEATLSALETTLTGSPEKPAAPPVPAAPAPNAPEPTSHLDMGPSSATMKLTNDDIKAALSAMANRPAATPAVAVRQPVPPVPIRAEVPIRPVPVRDEGAAPAASTQNPDLLKIQMGQETFNNVTVEQMNAWIEQGRVLEFHLVARQFSEHWIEASKVPALRPAFDQVRRQRQGEAEDPNLASELQPSKRGLFGGLFGRN